MTSPVKLAAKIHAEFFGTLVLVLGGCGTAVLAGDKVGYLGVAFAFGLTVVAGAYAFGHISGAHFNPAVTVGLAASGRFAWSSVPTYVVAQLAGASAAGAILYAIASGKDGFSAVESGFATNGYAERSPDGYSLLAVIVTELVLTVVFVRVIIGATHKNAISGFAGLVIGLTLTLIHLVSIPVSNTSVNPARSLGVAWFVPDALSQVWVFVLVPIVGGLIAGLVAKFDENFLE